MTIPVPHLAPLKSPLSDGHEIVIEGQIHHDAKRVTISLCEGQNVQQTTPLTYDIRFFQNEVVRNHFHKNWGTEEKHGGFPFKKGENVKIKIVLKNDTLQIFVNDQHFCDFKLRLGKETLRNVLIEGDITLNKVSLPGSDSSHHGGSHIEPGHSIQDPAVPVNIQIAPLQSGRKIVVTGVPTGRDRFTVNLMCGSSPNDNIACHFDVRFNYGNSQNKIIVTDRIDGKWGTEDREHSCFPFKANEPFELVFKVKEDSVKFIVDDEKLDKFNFRVKPDKINHINILGEVRINFIKA